MNVSPTSGAGIRPHLPERDVQTTRPEDIEQASRQFESILVRQFLTDSMGPLLEGGATGEVFGYLLTDSLANSISQAGGLGFSSVIQAQLSEKKS
jgi:flagellar protein FlgJ